MTALLIVAVLAVAGFAAFKISKSKEKVSNNESSIIEPVKSEQPKVEVVAPVKKELTLKAKKQNAEKKAEPKQKKPTTKKTDKKQK